jgi:hypothetical protein
MTAKKLRPKDPYFSAANPKDLVAQSKLDLSLVPETAIIAEALAFLEGALKYGRYNWRMAPVKMSVYYSALLRHALKLHAGDLVDSKTFLSHLGYIRCCAGIMIDALHHGTLIDDRPPRGRVDPDIEGYLDHDVVKLVEHLQELFKKEEPKQYTIKDVFTKPKQLRQRRSRGGRRG